MLWQQLITDGHIRSARLRHGTPPFLFAAGAALVVGATVLVFFPSAQPRMAVPTVILNQRVADLREPVRRKFSSLTAPALPYNAVTALPPSDELPKIVSKLRDSLRNTGEPPPANELPVRAVKDAEEFWSGNWPNNAISYLDKGDLRAFGAIVATRPTASTFSAYPTPARPLRWLAIFRKTSTGWDDVAIQVNGFVVPDGEKPVTPQDIPLSLRSLMNLPEMPK